MLPISVNAVFAMLLIRKNICINKNHGFYLIDAGCALFDFFYIEHTFPFRNVEHLKLKTFL